MVEQVVLFQGSNAATPTAHRGLWETNGTTAGTFELTPIGGANASGLQPSNLVSFNGEALFEGSDTSGQFGLWVTNGSAAGTTEIAGTSGLSPNDLTVFNGQVLFNGTWGSTSGLWTTNGTAAGTHQVTGIAGVDTTTGLSPSDLTVFNGHVLFSGESGANVSGPIGHLGLWTTDGTGAGTGELTSITGAATTGLGLNPHDLTVFGNKLLFAGTDSSNKVGLWETNGTSGGTSELVAGALSTGLNPSELTVLGADVLFSGQDASGDIGLWKLNGTTATEITGITDIDGVAVPDLHPKFLTTFDGQVLFNGLDSHGHEGLWVTNGTATHELLASAPGGGGASDLVGLDPTGFEVYNGIVLFNGVDSSGHRGLWSWNGTTAQELSSGLGASTGLSPFDLTSVSIATSPPPPPPTNFSLQDTTTGVSSQTNGTAYSGPVAGLQWEYIYSGSDNMNVTANVPNVFIHTGSGEDAINVSHSNGNNVLDGSTGSNFLVGGTGNDTFFVDDRSPSADIWSTVSNFHAGDAATIFGITQSGFNTSWVNGQGATGFTGLTLHVTGGGHPTASLTLAGFSTADLSNGRISTTWGREADGTPYLYVHANS